MNTKKILVVIFTIIIIVAVVILTVLLLNNNNKEPENKPNISGLKPEVKVTGMLKEYLDKHREEYYLKYTGKFKNQKGSYETATVEYSKQGDNYAIKSSELNVYIICKKNIAYSISEAYKTVVQMSENSIDTTNYNLIKDFGQTYVKSGKEDVNKITYDYEEYIFNKVKIRYYFQNGEIKQIVTKENNQEYKIKIIRTENNSKEELFLIPQDYTLIKA